MLTSDYKSSTLNAPDAVTASTDHSPVIVLDAGHGIN